MTDSLVQAFRRQVRWCTQMGSPFTAQLLDCAADQLERGGAIAKRLRDWPGDPVADLVALRLAGAVHAIVLSGEAPALAAGFPPHARQFDAARLWPLVEQALQAHESLVDSYLASAPQTNEVARAGVLLGGFLEIARRVGLPLRLLEIGASAGLNQIWDRFRYEFDAPAGRAAWGDAASPVVLSPRWEGPLPALDARLAVATSAASDVTPIDLEDAAQRLRLRSYVWADQRERLERLDRAIELARQARVRVERADAGDWLAQRLAERADGCCTVVFHSIVWTYLDDALQARIRDLIERAGAARTDAAPLAWLRLEHTDAGAPPRLLLDAWPGGRHEMLAEADAHGSWVRWRG